MNLWTMFQQRAEGSEQRHNVEPPAWRNPHNILHFKVDGLVDWSRPVAIEEVMEKRFGTSKM